MDDDGAAVEAVETRALVVLDLEQLEQFDLLGRRSHHPQVSSGVGEQDARCRRLEQLDAARRQHRQHFDHVEVVDEGVDDLDERDGCEGVPFDRSLMRVLVGHGVSSLPPHRFGRR